MTHDNRGRLTVDLGGKWRLYSGVLPAGCKVLGTVSRDIGEIGALIRFDATGLYAQLNAGAVKTLDQRKVAAAIAEAE